MKIVLLGLTFLKQSVKKYWKLLKYYRENINQRGNPSAMIDFLQPEAIGIEMKRLSEKFEDNPAYFDCRRFEHKYMFPFVAKAYQEIVNHIHPDARILDICGGPGNLGLGLAFAGFNNYVVADIDDLRMRWGVLLWKRFGKQLNWKKENVLKMSFRDGEFDVVVLLGWENASLPYTYALRECLRVLKKNGTLIFTYLDVEGIIEGNWDFDPSRSYSYLPYSISRKGIQKLCSSLHLIIDKEEEGGHLPWVKDFFPDRQERKFPQYILFCRKGE
jgi:2-polyprenyl-3-methyl-5-hydroxy-6-metoxy-1,4-benzoquinol methylase